jgi:NAD(P)H-nitrite reductase large subunit
MNKKLKFTAFLLIVFGVGCSLFQGFCKSSANANMHYVVIGCSAAGFYAAKELVKLGKNIRVSCISEENSNPYNKTQFHSYVAKKGQRSSRVDLSKGNSPNLEFILGAKVIAIDSANKTISFADNKTISYDKLLIATGARPFVPPHLSALLPTSKIRFYNTKDDVNAILDVVDNNLSAHVVIVGAGIRSLELSDGLKRRNSNIKITILNRSAQFLGEHGDVGSDEFIIKRLKEADINFIAPANIKNVSEHENKLKIGHEGGELLADLMVFALGTVSNSELAKSAQLELYADGSIKVDNQLKTTNKDIYAAGDVAGFKNPLGEGWVRSAKWRSSKQQGQIAAANMLGQHRTYKHEPAAFMSSFFGMKAVVSGNVRSRPLNSSLTKAETKRYLRYVLEDKRLKGFMTIWDKGQKRPNIFLLRRKLNGQGPVSAAELYR